MFMPYRPHNLFDTYAFLNWYNDLKELKIYYLRQMRYC